MCSYDSTNVELREVQVGQCTRYLIDEEDQQFEKIQRSSLLVEEDSNIKPLGIWGRPKCRCNPPKWVCHMVLMFGTYLSDCGDWIWCVKCTSADCLTGKWKS